MAERTTVSTSSMNNNKNKICPVEEEEGRPEVSMPHTVAGARPVSSHS